MTKLQALRVTAAVVTGLSFAGVGVAGAGSHHYNGGGKKGGGATTTVTNTNSVGVQNTTNQNATSGPATVDGGSQNNKKDKHRHGDSSDPRELGDATSGDAMNDNKTKISVDVSNDSCGCVSGDSEGHKKGGTLTITNTNGISIVNTTNQNATSGPATVTGNGNGGSATSGNASNSNDTTINVSASNN